MKDKNGNVICQGDIIRGKYCGLGETTIHTEIVREDLNWDNWETDTVEIVGNLKNGIQS